MTAVECFILLRCEGRVRHTPASVQVHTVTKSPRLSLSSRACRGIERNALQKGATAYERAAWFSRKCWLPVWASPSRSFVPQNDRGSRGTIVTGVGGADDEAPCTQHGKKLLGGQGAMTYRVGHDISRLSINRTPPSRAATKMRPPPHGLHETQRPTTQLRQGRAKLRAGSDDRDHRADLPPVSSSSARSCAITSGRTSSLRRSPPSFPPTLVITPFVDEHRPRTPRPVRGVPSHAIRTPAILIQQVGNKAY